MTGFKICKKTLALLLALVLLVGALAPAALADPDEEEETEEKVLDSGLPIPLASPSEIVIELSSDTVLLSRDAGRTVNPGSIAKIAALYVLCSECFKGRVDLKTEVTVTEEMMAGGSGVIPVKMEEVLTFQDLLYLMYSDYSDTAAYAAAITAVGSADNLVKEMNSFARSCQCTNTLFTNITGAYDEEMHITPADLVLMLRRAMQNSLFMEVFTARSYIVPETNKSISRSLYTSNLLQRSSSGYYRAACCGGRFAGLADGYTTVALAEKEDSEMQLLIIVSGGLTTDDNYGDAGNLIDWVLETFEWRTLCHAGEAVASVPVEMGKGSDHVNVGPASDINAMLDIGLDTEKFTRKVTLYDESVTAPVEKGTVLGEVSIQYQGEEYGHAALVANSPVELNTVSYLKNEIKETAGQKGIIKLLKYVGILVACYLVYAVIHWVVRIIIRVHRTQKKRTLRRERRRNARAYDPGLPDSNTRRIAIYRTENGLTDVAPEACYPEGQPEEILVPSELPEGSEPIEEQPQEKTPEEEPGEPNGLPVEELVSIPDETMEEPEPENDVPDENREPEQNGIENILKTLLAKLKGAFLSIREELSGTAYEPENPETFAEEPEELLEEAAEEPEEEPEIFEPEPVKLDNLEPEAPETEEVNEEPEQIAEAESEEDTADGIMTMESERTEENE